MDPAPERARTPRPDAAGHHHLPVHEVVLLLDADLAHGLDPSEARARYERFGPNVLPHGRRHGSLHRLVEQFRNPLIVILIAAGAATAAAGEPVDAAVIFGVVIVNAIVGFVQESRAEHALDTLRSMIRTEATVLRSSHRTTVDSARLVPGDVVLLAAGDRVPADLRVVGADGLRVDESALTGESVPVGKEPTPVAEDTALADRANMAYSGTLVVAGAGTGLVVATGAETELGVIHRLVGAAEEIATPLTRRIARFSRLLTVVILGLAAGSFAIGIARGEPAAEMLTAAVALAVGAIPEGLPAVVTITLAVGVRRMARRHVIIRRLPAVETLGSTTVVCTDKTGTLTENQMTVAAVVAGGDVYDVTGAGFTPEGDFLLAGEPVDGATRPALRACLLTGLRCNDAELRADDHQIEVVGDPTEVALVVAAAKAGLARDDVDRIDARRDTLAFDSARRYMATAHDAGTGPLVVSVKGAVETVLAMCTGQLGRDGSIETLDTASVLAAAERLADRALRVLAVARAEADVGIPLDPSEIEASDLVFVGLQAMADPPREAAAAAVRVCHDAGIEVKMITGDHPATARAIATELGIGTHDPTPPSVVSGAELARRDEAAFRDTVVATSVFARVSPEQKLRLVQVLQHEGEVVAMTGDGVNDAPALKQADIGVAMGRVGTEVAKESADMVLTDDDFASIEAAVEEGRTVFDNLSKFIVWALPTSMGEGLVILAAILLGTALPILPVQVLWVNMITAVALGLPLAVEPSEAGLMTRPPRDPSQPLLDRVLIGRIVLVSTLMLIAAFGLFEWEQQRGESIEAARTVAVNTFVLLEITYLLNCRSLRRSLAQIGFASNPWVLVGIAAMTALQVLYTYAPFMQTLFGSAALDLQAWITTTAAGIVGFGVVGVEKWVRARDRNGEPPTDQTDS